MQEEAELIDVSPRHAVRLAEEYVALVRKAPKRDFVVRTIARRQANGLPLMQADIVIAGQDTRQRFSSADRYPLHFRKTYYPGRLHGDPKVEFDRQSEASAVIGIPPPIGYEDEVFRTCLLPGTPYDRLSPFQIEPEERALERARALTLATAAGLIRLAEEGFAQLSILHQKGLAHGDAQLHNFIVCPSPLEMLLIDFEGAIRQEEASAELWEKACSTDFEPLLRESVLLQCCLGAQGGNFATMARASIERSFRDPARIQREIDRHAPEPA
jgi:hypothetical protein